MLTFTCRYPSQYYRTELGTLFRINNTSALRNCLVHLKGKMLYSHTLATTTFAIWIHGTKMLWAFVMYMYNKMNFKEFEQICCLKLLYISQLFSFQISVKMRLQLLLASLLNYLSFFINFPRGRRFLGTIHLLISISRYDLCMIFK